LAKQFDLGYQAALHEIRMVIHRTTYQARDCLTCWASYYFRTTKIYISLRWPACIA
jgi:hypothetical protein